MKGIEDIKQYSELYMEVKLPKHVMILPSGAIG